MNKYLNKNHTYNLFINKTNTNRENPKKSHIKNQRKQKKNKTKNKRKKKKNVYENKYLILDGGRKVT